MVTPRQFLIGSVGIFTLLTLLGKTSESALLIVVLFSIGYFALEYLVSTYLNYVLQVRNGGSWVDNRTANFLTWDVLKFILVLVSLVVVLLLGLNHVLNNETIAAVLGGLVGSLLTLKGSYTDLPPVDPKQLEALQKVLEKEESRNKDN